MHGPINVKSPNNISKWQVGFNSALKGLIYGVPSKCLETLTYRHGVMSLNQQCRFVTQFVKQAVISLS
jgi:hypothetical protein